MKSKKMIVLIIILLSIVILSLIGGMVLLIRNKVTPFHFYTRISQEVILDEAYEINPKEIKIMQTAGEIEIKKSKDWKYRLKVYGKRKNLEVKMKDTLEVKYQEDPCIGFCVQKEISKIELYIPENQMEKITIHNKYGDTFVEEAYHLELDADCGDIEVGKVENAVIHNSYGDIKVEEAKVLKVKMDAGDITLGKVEELDAENHYGDIEIEEIKGKVGIKEDCGDIEIKRLKLIKDSTIVNSYGNIEIEEAKDIFIDAETSLGDQNITKNDRKSEITLKIRNSCGDIIVG